MNTIKEYKCPCCGGAISFDVQSQNLKCPYCDTEFDVESLAAYAESLGEGRGDDMEWEGSAGTEWREGESDGLRIYICNSCNGEIVGDENTGATFCPFCGSPVVMKAQFSGALRPDCVIPFKLDKEAAKKAYIYDQIMKLPNGFQSRAQQLSGGQQQRIAIARMFLKNPPIIFLDEPTASLDAIATEQIKASIDAIKKDRTVIIISHSISQIIDSDVIYALKEGRVEQSGNPDELYQQGGIYKEIVDASARSLNIDKLAQTLDTNGDGILFN